MIAREMVQRIWRKMHSPGLSGNRTKALEEFSVTKNRAKRPDFLGWKKPGGKFLQILMAEGEELGTNLLRRRCTYGLPP
jgi:hypothetical protein